MPRSKTRGSRKDHNKRVAKRNEEATRDIKAINALRQKIFQEAVERHKQEQEASGKTGNTYKIKL
jgi:hypothetical protein